MADFSVAAYEENVLGHDEKCCGKYDEMCSTAFAAGALQFEFDLDGLKLYKYRKPIRSFVVDKFELWKLSYIGNRLEA